MPLLSLLIWLPILGGVWVGVAGTRARDVRAVRADSLVISAVTFLLSLVLWAHFDPARGDMQFVERHDWIPAFDIYYHLGIDGIALPLILLTTLSTVLVVLAGWVVITDRVAHYMAAFLILEGAMIGVFAARDVILFYVFWEAMLIPMFLIIGIWGGRRRVYAALKFFLYTFLGSVFMLVGLLYLYAKAGTFDLAQLQNARPGLLAQQWLFLAFLLAFAVKVPMWPVHTWLPDAHVEAPTGGSVILAAIMLKMGAYGFLRFSLPILPDACRAFAVPMMLLSLIAIVYIGFVALVQQDMKKLIAYSSISHMGFVTLGFFLIFPTPAHGGYGNMELLGLSGALVQMISHGFVSGALFLCVGVLYDRMHSREIRDYGGVANTMPAFASLMTLFAMANCGLPGTSGFVGEFMVILAAMHAGFWYSLIAALTLILGAAYTLWMLKRVVFGAISNDRVAALSDIGLREGFVLGVLAILVLGLGVWPAPLTHAMQASLEALVAQISPVQVALP